MGTLTSWTTPVNLLKTISPCDIIEFNRIKYSHFGFYIGNGICIHVQAPDESSLDGICSNSEKRRGTKVAQRLIDIAGRDVVRVNNAEVTAFQLGVNRRPKNEAIQLAMKGLPVDESGNVQVGQSIKVCYFLVSAQNCEGYSMHWRYDVPYGWSMQVLHSLNIAAS